MKRKRINSSKESRKKRKIQEKVDILKVKELVLKEVFDPPNTMWRMYPHSKKELSSILIKKISKNDLNKLKKKVLQRILSETWVKENGYSFYPTTKYEMVDWIFARIMNKVPSREKRFAEKKYIEENDFIGTSIDGTYLPFDILLNIFSYLKIGSVVLNSIGCVSSVFYLAILSSFRNVTIYPRKVHDIPILVLNNVKKITFSGLYTKTLLNYILENANNVEHILMKKNNNMLINTITTKKIKLQKLKKLCLVNKEGFKSNPMVSFPEILKSLLPNVTSLTIPNIEIIDEFGFLKKIKELHLLPIKNRILSTYLTQLDSLEKLKYENLLFYLNFKDLSHNIKIIKNIKNLKKVEYKPGPASKCIEKDPEKVLIKYEKFLRDNNL